MAGQVGRRRVYSDDRANRAAARPERVVWFDATYDHAGWSRSGSASTPEIRRPASTDIIPALLQLLGWVGWLGIGYLAWGRVLLGALMLIGWWTVFWVLSFFTLVTQTVALPLTLLAWFLVPLMTSVALWAEARREYSTVRPFEPMDAALRPAPEVVILDALGRRLAFDVTESRSTSARMTGVSHGARRWQGTSTAGLTVEVSIAPPFEDEAAERNGGRHRER